MQVLESRRLLVAGALLGGSLAPGMVLADDAAPIQDSSLDQVVVTGVRSLTSDKLPDGVLNTAQTINVIPRHTLDTQGITRLQDALRNVPGITLNAGEGSARGDTVNLRGFPAFNDFFLDGIRDAAIYTRDSFDLEAVEVLKGPSAVLFGRGSTGGAINQVSKAPTLAPFISGQVIGGTNDEIRGTADIDQTIGPNSAIRINAMGEHSKIAERDYATNRRWGFAPSVSFGIGQRDTVTASFLHQTEDNTQDTGIPFVGALPAQVPRTNFYGLTSDRATADVNVGTLRYRHEFNGDIDIANTLRYGDYAYGSFVNSAQFGYAGSPGAPTAATPIASILAGRDSPSNYGRRTDLINQTDLTAHLDTGGVSHTLVLGAEFGRERDNIVRLANDLGTIHETPATSLLHPNPNEVAFPEPPKTRSITTALSAAAYALDTVHIGSHVDVTGGLRFDRFSAHYRVAALMPGVSASSLVPLDHVDDVVSPRAAIVYKPTDNQRFYVSYGTSFDPSAEALALSAKTANLDPVKAKTYEIGTKLDWMGGRLTGTAAIFHTEVDNAQTTDPDHPTALILGGDQRVQGFEVGLTGYLTRHWEITAGYTYLDGKTIRSTTASIVGKDLPNVAQNALNVWTEYELSRWEVGAGFNYLGQRYADSAQTAILPGFTLVNAMVSYKLNNTVSLQVNANNILNKLAYTGAYYSSPIENHVVPAPGRTMLFTASFHD